MRVPRDNHLDEAWQIVSDLCHGTIGLEAIEKQLTTAAAPAIKARAETLLAQLQSRDDRENERILRSAFTAAAGGEGEREGFEQFRARIENELAGIVITAHPTFALSIPARDLTVAQIAGGMSGDRIVSAGTIGPIEIHRQQAPTLEEELDVAGAALKNLREALRRTLRVAVDVAAESFPDRYRELRPRFFTLATWVGFDLDGRTDIGWNSSLSCRYRLALDGLDALRTEWRTLRLRHGTAAASAESLFAVVEQSLDALTDCFETGVAALGQESAASIRLGRLNRVALDRRGVKQDAIGAIDAALEELSGLALPAALGCDLVVFRSEWESLGLGLARLHFRLNSVQLHNAIRPEISMQSAPDSSASRRRHLAAITDLLDRVVPVNVHYGSVARERTTAKRVFMLAAQFCKHFDERTPMRLLIAESDTPFTLLVALYYAKLFGVETHIEISPLFETADGLHHGDRVISELLDNPHFLGYLHRQGRFCVQLGFSDSGRYIGQPAATLAIERFKLRLVQLWEQRGLGAIALTFFDTFGESIGRGAHPDSLTDRFRYTHSNEVRRRLASLATAYKHEVSFQGGDGYLWFASPVTAFAVLSNFLATRFEVPDATADTLYTESGWALDFFLTLQAYQNRLTKHAGYLALIDSLGRNLLYPAGSRPAKRQAGTGKSAGLESIASLRAIPNNAILQQLGYLANSCAGLGQAGDQAAETFLAVLEQSDRLQRILSLVRGARAHSDITMLDAYGQILSAGYWLDRSGQSLDRDWNRRLRRVSRVLEESFDQTNVAHFVRELRQDAALLDDVLDEQRSRGTWSSADALTRLHVLRLALIQYIYIKAMEIPRFSSRIEVSLGSLIEALMRLEVPDTIATLREIFPVSQPVDDSEVYAEKDTYNCPTTGGYAAEHAEIFDPILKAHRLVLEISALIALQLGTYG